MIVESMMRKEIREHLLREFYSNKNRIDAKLNSVFKKVIKAGKNFHTYEQKVGFNTVFTLYLYDVKRTNYVIGCWMNTERGLCFANVGFATCNFYTSHFFKRYAERHLKRDDLLARESARVYFENYKVGLIDAVDEIETNVHRVQMKTECGLALGFHDSDNCINVFNTYIEKDMTKGIQSEFLENSQHQFDYINSIGNEEFDELLYSQFRIAMT